MLDRIQELKEQGKNPLLEADCGTGKRFITHQLITERFPDLRFVIVANSRASQEQTVTYFINEYGIQEEEVGDLNGCPYYMRKELLETKRIIITTAQVFVNTLDKYLSKELERLIEDIDALIINEVDLIVRRQGDTRSLIHPWPQLLAIFQSKWIIGMTGTLRDEHFILSNGEYKKMKDADSLLTAIPNSEIMPMQEFMSQDLEDHLEPTRIETKPVDGGPIKAILAVIDLMLGELRPKIRSVVKDITPSTMHLDRRVPRGLKGRYQWLLFLRRFVYARPPSSFIHYLNNRYFKKYLNYHALCRTLPKKSPKVDAVVSIAKKHFKTVVLCSYLDMIDDIEDELNANEIPVYRITGETFNRGTVLETFKEEEGNSVLVMSSVGERDLDIPEAEVMIVCDVTNTSKTMYQRIKRTRGGTVYFLMYEGTSEVRKVKGLIERVMKKYPWSIENQDHRAL
jgi:superfamily II DNA or RNA helicase